LGCSLGGRGGEDLAPAPVEGVEVDVLDGQGVVVVAVEFASALGLADAGPVGSAVARAGEAGGLGQDGRVAVAGSPVAGQPAGDDAEQPGGEVGAATSGRMRNRALLQIRFRLAWRVAGSQPMQVSRGAHFRALAEKARAAIWPAAGLAARYRIWAPASGVQPR
jgi:hypothetical protein